MGLDDQTLAILSEADYVITSESFPRKLTGVCDTEEALEQLLRSHATRASWVVATLGEEGCVAVTRSVPSVPSQKKQKLDSTSRASEARVRISAHKLSDPIIDTTGAGDTFTGAAAYGISERWPLKRILEFANFVAAHSCTCAGARGGLESLGAALKSAGWLSQL